MDDVELFNKTEQGRDVNRHNYTPEEIAVALEQPVTKAIIALARLRNLPVFDGEFSWTVTGDSSLRMGWVNGDDSISLEFNTTVDAPEFVIEVKDASGTRSYDSVEALGSAE
jgi:sucrose phosphorylase